MPPQRMGTNQPHGGRQTEKNMKKTKKAKPLRETDLPSTECNKGDRRGGPGTPPSDDREENHYVSLSTDSILMEERELLRRSSVASVVKTLRGLGESRKVVEATASLFEPELKWSSECYEDDRILIHCPTEKIARELEKRGEITFSDFIVRYQPWSMDIDPSEKADGETRWIAGKGLPTFGRNIDTIARILKPVGDLVHLVLHGPNIVGHFRALVRLRRGRKFPAIIHATLLQRKYKVRLDLESGQPPLPWCMAPEKTGEEMGHGQADAGNERDNMVVSNLNEKDNDKLTQPLIHYSTSENIIQSENEDDSDEEYLDPILEREIELKFETMWKTQLDGEASNHSESPTKIHIDMGPNEISPPKPIHGSLGDDQTCIARPIIQSPTLEHGDGSKTSKQRESSTPAVTPDIPPQTPSRIKGKEPIIIGPHPDIDLSNHTWRLIHGSWIFMENTLPASLVDGTTLVEQGHQGEDMQKELVSMEEEDSQPKHTTMVALPKEAIRRSGRTRKPMTERLEKEGFIAPTTSKRKAQEKGIYSTSLSPSLLTLCEWQDRDLLGNALKVGIDLGTSEAQKISCVQHMREKELEWGREWEETN
ncbi:hypothetical protein J5N97_027688 [Dioscorea zingiberensis]|uniref:Uncharacterized protein n=1 Tax=Dioscorea zingiberensis TaxID=325984 RepID=A0A9D5H473_9LILI|nr:hypothetical protein J5N97_027688 [Dioscorea zingiberensis]